MGSSESVNWYPWLSGTSMGLHQQPKILLLLQILTNILSSSQNYSKHNFSAWVSPKYVTKKLSNNLFTEKDLQIDIVSNLGYKNTTLLERVPAYDLGLTCNTPRDWHQY
jgi:hypothetical protein